MQEAVPAGLGGMAAILGMAADRVVAICIQASQDTGQQVAPANYNSPEQIGISGELAAVEHAAELARAAGAKRAVMLHVSAPFHCAMMQPAQDRLAVDLHALHFNAPRIPIAANVDAIFVRQAEASRDTLIRQVTGAVRWVECVQLLIDQGMTHYIEVGSGRILGGLMRQIDRSQKFLHTEDSSTLEKTLAALSDAPPA